MDDDNKPKTTQTTGAPAGEEPTGEPAPAQDSPGGDEAENKPFGTGMPNKLRLSHSGMVVLVVVVCLAAVVLVFTRLNSQNVAEKQHLQDDAIFLITAGDTSTQVTMEDIQSLSPREVEANYKKSGKEPEVRHYTGVPFAEVLELKGIDPAGYGSVTFTALDGYSSAISIDQAIDPAQCWIVIEEEGEPLGTKEEGGSGPYRMILPQDRFSQNWCSFLMEATLRP